MIITTIATKPLTEGGHATVDCEQYGRNRTYWLIISSPTRGFSITPQPSKRAALAALKKLS